MRVMMMGWVALGLLLALGELGATPEEPRLCERWVEKNRSCEVDILSSCEAMIRERMLEQAQTHEGEARAEMEAAIETKAPELCAQFISQIATDSALSVCKERSVLDDPKARQQTERAVECLKKTSCAEYAACSLRVK